MNARPLRAAALIAGALAAAGTMMAAAQAPTPILTPYTERLPEDEIIYFVMPDRFENGAPSNDRGGIDGERSDHGFDPTHRAYYQGGDLAGLTDRLDYIAGLGATAIWLTPIFRNQPVQGPDEFESAGYHGYWITDFLDVDPHLGTREEFAAFVDAAHERDLKVYMDIITNHTADVISYRECVDTGCPYRSRADYPWTRQGGPDGEAINEGFLGDDPAHQTSENFAKLTDVTYAYTPYVREGLENAKNPPWLNELRYYTNRGDTHWEGESSTYGDFSGLDDINTQDPFVVQGFIDIFSAWISDFRVDGFRIDTVRHVRPEFWRAWAPAILAHAQDEGVENFHMFGEVYEFDPAILATWVVDAGLPSVLDFAFQGAVQNLVTGEAGVTDLARVIMADSVYGENGAAALRLPTFLGNHDMGRLAGAVRAAHPDISDEELFARVRLAHAVMMFSRGVPVIYYGDEQGFVSDGGDQLARETMFPSQVAEYNDNDLIATDATTAASNFDSEHPLYRAIAAMADARRAHAPLRRSPQVIRHSEQDDNVFAFSRIDEETGVEILAAFNAGQEPRAVNVTVDGRSARWTALMGDCAPTAHAAGSYGVELPPLDFVLCRSDWSAD